MYRILIVDDEKMIREGLKNAVDWESVNCTVVGLAGNGEEGLNVALKLEPDIIITDIKMPVMSGIKMAENILKERPNTKFIMVTGFRDFKDAKDAIKLSAIDFIQKPIEDDELLSAISSAINEIDRDSLDWSNMHNAELIGLLQGDNTDYKLIDHERDIRVALIQTHDTWLMGAYLSKVMQESKRVLKNKLLEFVIYSDNIVALIIDGNDEYLIKSLTDFKNKVFDEYNITMTLGISRRKTIQEISELYIEAQMALSSKIKHGIGKIILYENLQNYSEEEKLIVDYKKFNNLLSEGNIPKIEMFIDEVVRICEHNDYFFGEVKAIFLDLHMIIVQKISNNELEVLHPVAYTSYKLRNSRTMEELQKEFKNILSEMISVINTNLDKIKTNDEIVNFIQSNFQEDLALQDISEVFYMSESTISRRIKARTDMSFSEYLTFLRIEESIKLLKYTDLSISEISDKVGYTDYRYFSTVFKRRQGVTPSQFRHENEL